MGFPKTFKTIEIMQQCKYGFNKEYVSKLVEWSVIKDYAYICHDKDMNDDGSQAEPHIHLMLRFNDSVPTTAILKKIEGVCEVQHLSKMKKWTLAIAYLTHSTAKAKADGKYQYDDSEVISNYDWLSDKEQGVKDSALRLNDIVSGIDNGTIREYNYTEYISMTEYTKYKRQIDTAFKYRIDRLEGVDRDMQCIFITGESGCGKTTYAKQLCAEKGYSYTISSGANDVLDSYKGQDALILDDLRPSCLGLVDLLKMLDNNTASSVRSRYKNKVLECKLIVITTTVSIERFFSNVFESENESKIQLMRRCKTYITMDTEYMEVYVYSDCDRKYKFAMKLENPCIFLKQKEEEDVISFAESILGNTIQGAKRIDDGDDWTYEDIELPFD